MKYLFRLFKATERRILRAWIVWERPDLKAKPFMQQLNTYVLETIEVYAKKEEGTPLPLLLERALGYDATGSKGHYRALYMLMQHKHTELLFEYSDELIKNGEMLIEVSQARKLGRQAIAVLNGADEANRLN